MLKAMQTAALSAAVIVTLSAAATHAATTTLYATDFESPSFVAGDITGQNGWLNFAGGTSGTVQTAFKHTGQQAFRIASGSVPGSGDHLWYKPINYDTTGAAGSTVRVSWSMNVHPSAVGQTTGFAGMDLYAGNDRAAIVGVDVNGNVVNNTYVNGQSTLEQTGFVAGFQGWHDYIVEMDFVSRTFDAWVDNNPVVTDCVFFQNNNSNIFGDADFSVRQPGTNSIYYDDLSIVAIATPEPASTTALFAAGALLRRRVRA